MKPLKKQGNEMNDLWFQQVSTEADVPTGYVVGVEVPAGHPVLSCCSENLDPQHGGSIGFGGFTGEAACTVAAAWVQRFAMPLSAWYVTTRIDPDSLVTAMILSGRIPAPLLTVADVQERLRLLAVMDSGSPLTGGWRPELKPQSVADCPVWGPVAAMCLAYLARRQWLTECAKVQPEQPLPPEKGNGVTLSELEAAAIATLLGSPRTPLLALFTERAMVAWGQAADLAMCFRVDGAVAIGTDLPFLTGTWAAAYSRAPIGLLSAILRGQRKFTVACSRDLGLQGSKFFAAFKSRVAVLESGWGGQGTIIGSPFAGTNLTLEQVLDAVQTAARDAGIKPI